MKILAIRGKNLASLSAEFEINFEAEPLASAGLFAITGATGAGKSTLLDALCLALYERTPRLERASSKGAAVPDVSDNTVSPSDPRAILRRGSAEGFAEVDFAGSDGQRYRCRWSVRRARLNAQGKLQNSDIKLTRIADGQVLSEGTKTETLKRIETLVGLNFDQFTRAVLLAQNDFATFLKASDDERAELLQTLTGTETFSQISKQAFARMKAEEDRLRLLQSKLSDQVPMLPEIRTEKELQREAQTESVKVFADQKALVEAHLRWHQQWTQFKANQAAASQSLLGATTERDLAEPRRLHLRRVEQVQPARPMWAERERLTQQIAEATQTQTDSQAAHDKARADLITRQAAHHAATERQTAAETRWAVAQPEINSAKALDASLDTLAPQVEAASAAEASARKHLEAAQASRDDADKRLKQATSDHAANEAWLKSHAHLKPLAEGWQLWETLLTQGQGHLRAIAHTVTLIKEHAATAQALAASKDRAQLEEVTARAEMVDVGKVVEELTKACAAVDIEQLALTRLQLETRRDTWSTAAQIWQKRVDIQYQQTSLAEQEVAHAAAMARYSQELLACQQSQPLLQQSLTTAEQSLGLARLAASQDVESLRESLQPDQPCPVCGALSHPYATHAPVVDAMIQRLQDQVDKHRQQLNALLMKKASAHTGHTHAQTEQARLARERATLATQWTDVMTQWDALDIRSEADAVPEADRSPWLAAQHLSHKTQLEQLAEQETSFRRELKRKDEAQLKLQTATQAADAAHQVLVELEIKASSATQSIQTAQQQLALEQSKLNQTLAQLDAAFGSSDWHEPWQQDPDAFNRHCAGQAQMWQDKALAQAALHTAIATLKVEMAGHEAACTHAAQQLGAQTEAHAKVKAELDTFRLNRAALFEGRPVAAVEHEMQNAIDMARQAVTQAHVAVLDVQGEAVRLAESVRLAGVQLQQHRQAHAVACEQLNTWLGAFHATTPSAPLSLEDLASLLNMSAQWLSEEREALQQLDRAVAEARAVLATREESLTAHLSERTDDRDESDLQQQLANTLQGLSVANDALSALKLELARDDERLSKSADLQAAIQQQAGVTRVWSQLSELIGSADGKKFRNFAQQYTLDILLGYANAHLQNLSRRYRLQRIKDTLGLLVVDQDMGDEVRSVHSLSGGESFLVSLALALGLASLSSHRVKVESLFIDEGFGSLDADALGVAMDALDNLQAQGRKVGVISHVQEMTERIGTRVQVVRQAGGLSSVMVS